MITVNDHGTTEEVYVSMLPRDRMICVVVADIIIVQCILVIVGSSSILICAWTPDVSTLDFDKLARIMYMFDFEACGYKLEVTKHFAPIQFSNDTKGLDVIPIHWKQAITTVTTRLSAKTRLYIIVSLSFHCVWLVIVIVLRIFVKKNFSTHILKLVISVTFYSCILMMIFDVSMGLVYISHIKQSLTKGMVLRYSGWSSTLKLTSYEEFAGWLPIAASICWMRGIVIFVVNIYICRMIKIIMKKIRRREIRKKYENERYNVVPEPIPVFLKTRILVYRNGVRMPNQF